MNTPQAPLLLTPGEPAGIGPEIACRVALERSGLVLVADPDHIAETLRTLGFRETIHPWQVGEPLPEDGIALMPEPLPGPAVPGRPSPEHAAGLLRALDRAVDVCMQGQAAGLVTGPLHKAAINDAGIPFTGHTEYLAGRAGVERVVMMLVADTLRVALATTHLPLAAVPAAITSGDLESTLRILHHDLANRFRIARPRIAVLGLNPHAGEDGHLGDEEQRIIEPVVRRLREAGLDLVGPLPADTAFLPDRLARFDAVLAMYHDQGLPVLKYAGFGRAVNITLGLPFVRTSVDHGTALDLAGTGRADPGSLVAAIDLAAKLSAHDETANERE